MRIKLSLSFLSQERVCSFFWILRYGYAVVAEGGSSLALAEGNNEARDGLVRDLSGHP